MVGALYFPGHSQALLSSMFSSVLWGKHRPCSSLRPTGKSEGTYVPLVESNVLVLGRSFPLLTELLTPILPAQRLACPHSSQMPPTIGPGNCVTLQVILLS